ncbi:MAG: YebC/PmpR family DNA-binding transcriptional regulator [Chloroflexota bacterium]|nr:YebC/PmpR family DNA-binding transcriptional regulator [Chloroflexota bacterium]
MSGHSKWASIKHQKGIADAKRGKLFTKLGKEITIAVRQGGSDDPQMNARLRLAVQKARDNNMPLDNIERAIKRATGSSDGSSLAELTLEGYGPGGSAILVQVLTDNRNRSISEVRNVFNRSGVSLGESGCVSWIFEPKGVITVEDNSVDAEELALSAIDAGADDVKVDGATVEIYTQTQDMESLRKVLEENGVVIASAELSQVPTNLVTLDEKAAMQSLKLLEKLEDLDDVQHVFTNADFPDEILEQYQGT